MLIKPLKVPVICLETYLYMRIFVYKNPLCFSCDTIEYKSIYVVKNNQLLFLRIELLVKRKSTI